MEFKLVENFGDQLNDYKQALEIHYPILDSWLKRMTGNNQIVYIDATDVEYIGYSYSKQIFRKVMTNLLTDQYNIYSICFKYNGEDFEKVFDGVTYDFTQKEYTTFLIGELFSTPKIIGYITTHEPRESKKETSKKKNLKAVLEYIVKKRELFTNDIAEHLNLKLPNTNRILKELEEKRLIRRVKETSPSGGPIFLNKSIFNS